MRCDECKFWARRSRAYGTCSALPGDKVDIEVDYGCCGGSIDEVETHADFFCGYFEVKAEDEVPK